MLKIICLINQSSMHLNECMAYIKTVGRARIQRGHRETRPSPWKITKLKGFLAIQVCIPWKVKSYQASIQCLAIKMAFRWRADDGPILLIFYLDPLSPHQLQKCCQSSTPSGKKNLDPRFRVIKTYTILNSTEHNISTNLKTIIWRKKLLFLLSNSIMLINI